VCLAASRGIVLSTAILILAVLGSASLVESSALVFHGEHHEVTCRDDCLVDVVQTIIATANVTQNATMVATYSFPGKLASNISCTYDPEVYDPHILGAIGDSEFVVRCKATQSIQIDQDEA